jgi:sugar phosphate permease
LTIKVPSKRKRKVFPGWWTVIASGIISMWGFGVYLYSFGLFVTPIETDLRLSRAKISGAGSLGRLEGGFEGLFGGWFVDRYGPRVVCLIGVFIGGLGLILMYFINSWWSYYVVWGIASLGFNLGLSLPLDAAVANWFVRRRGLAMAITRSLIGLCSVTVMPLVAWLIGLVDWRLTLVIAGATTWLIGLPLAWFLIKPRRPEYYGLLPDGEQPRSEDVRDVKAAIEAGVKYAEKVEEIEFTARQAMRTSAFWIIYVAHSLHGMVSPAVSMHQIPYLTDRGVDRVLAAFALGLMVFASIPGRLIGGIIADRFDKNQLRFPMAGAYFLQCLGLLIFLQAQSMAMVYLYLALYGLGMGAAIGINVPLRARYFGRKAFATIGGVLRFLDMPAAMIAPIYAGWTYDVTGSYMNAFAVLTGLLFVSVIVMLFAKPPKPPAVVGDIDKFV